MKKLSKRARKQLKEKEHRREKKMAMAGAPYSNHKKRICYHYGWTWPDLETLLSGSREEQESHCYIGVEKDKDNRYVCQTCGKVFTQTQMEQLEKVCSYLERDYSYLEQELPPELPPELLHSLQQLIPSQNEAPETPEAPALKGIEPVEYYYKDKDEPVICRTLDGTYWRRTRISLPFGLFNIMQ